MLSPVLPSNVSAVQAQCKLHISLQAQFHSLELASGAICQSAFRTFLLATGFVLRALVETVSACAPWSIISRLSIWGFRAALGWFLAC